MRYNSNVGAFCLSAAIQNVTQYPGITSGTTIGIIQGRHPDNFQNENNMMDGADMTNAIVVLVNSGFVAGSPGNFLAERAFNYGPGEIINEGDPVYLSYGDGQRAEFNAKINRAAVAPVVPNSFFLFIALWRYPTMRLLIIGCQPRNRERFGTLLVENCDQN